MSSTSKNILVVEDEAIVQLHLSKIVESTGHHLLGAVAGSQAALELASRHKPDLVLMDIRLANGDDGITCAEALVREHDASILFITAHSGVETLARAMPLAAAGYLVKPFRVAEVTASISSALAARDREQRASSRERALSSAVDSLEEAIFVIDASAAIGFANPRGKQLSGWNEVGTSDVTLLDCLASEQRDLLEQAISDALLTRSPVTLNGLQLYDQAGVHFGLRLEPTAESGEPCLLATLTSEGASLSPERAEQSSTPRLLVYSHDTFGLGHIRRCMNLIRSISERVPDLCTLLVTGSPMAHKFELPPRTDYLKLPAVRKVAPDAYEPRSLGMSEQGILTLRRNLLLRTVSDYAPNLLLVDHSPTGMNDELQPALDELRKRGGCARILGLRDIIDSPSRVAKIWREKDMFNTLRQNYDHLIVYGSRNVYDTTREYAFPEDLGQRVRHVNYVSQRTRVGAQAAEIEPGLVVVTIGGGDGGADTVVQPFLEMMRDHVSDLDLHAEVLLGPFVAAEQREELQQLAEGLPVVLHDFIPDPTPLFRRAELVISTAGYNISAELLAHARRALPVTYKHLRAHETKAHLVCRPLL